MQIILCVNNRSFYNQKTEVICKTIHLRHYGLVKFCLVSETISCHVEMISGRNSLLWPSWLGQTTYFSLDQLIQTSFCSCIFVHPYNFRWLIQRTKTVQKISQLLFFVPRLFFLSLFKQHGNIFSLVMSALTPNKLLEWQVLLKMFGGSMKQQADIANQ